MGMPEADDGRRPQGTEPPLSRRVALGVALAVVYVLVAKAGLSLDAVSGFATLVWPPTGIALAALLSYGSYLWPGVAVGAFAANVWSGAPIPAALGIAIGNTLEAVVGAHLMRRVPGFSGQLQRVRDVVALVVITAGASTVLSATVGVLSLAAAGVVPDDRVGATWRAWWIGDLIGAIVVTPLLLCWSARPTDPREAARPTPQRSLEAALLAGALVATGVAVFGPVAASLAGPFQGPYLMFPALLWAAVRFEQRGAAVAMFATSVCAIAATTLGAGPFVSLRLSDSLLHLQVFMGVTAVTILILGALTAERRAAERALERAVRAREDFVSIAAHELRTPIAALQLSAQAARMQLERADDTPREVMVAKLLKIDRQVSRLTALVDQLLDISRLVGGWLGLEREDVDLAELATQVVERLQEQASRARCTVTVEAAYPVVGRWDRSRLDQVLTNLVGNALKYGVGKPVRVAVEAGGSSAVITIEDQGIGISEADQERIFERFERSDNARNYGGFGVGLWIVSQIVTAHGGRISVHSAPSSGARFRVELPTGAS